MSEYKQIPQKRKKVLGVKLESSVKYQAKVARIKFLTALIEKRESQIKKYHAILRDPDYMVAIFRAASMVKNSVIPTIEASDLSILIKSSKTMFFKGSDMNDKAAVKRLFRNRYIKRVGKAITGDNYHITMEGRNVLVEVSKSMTNFLIPLLKSAKHASN